jgi:HlyD family secretion protein
MKWKLNVLVMLVFSLAIGCNNNENKIGGSGLIEADEVVVSAETEGRVDQLFFDDGDVVDLNDTLLIVDPSRLNLNLEAAVSANNVSRKKLNTAKIQKEQAQQTEQYTESERNRIRSLSESGSATQKQLDQMEFEFTQARLARKSAEANIATIEAEINKQQADINRIKREINDCYPTAPINGTILEMFVEIGELLAKGRPITRLANLDTVWVKVYLPSGDFASVKLGDVATIDTETDGDLYRGVIVWTSQEAEFTPKNVQTKSARANLVYAVKVKIPNSDKRLKIGMPVFVTLD